MGRISSSLTKFLESDSMIGSVRRQDAFIVVLLMIPYTLFFMFWIVFDWDTLPSLVVPSIVLSFNIVGWTMISQQIREEAVSLGAGPFNMDIFWNESNVVHHSNILTGWRSLEEPDTLANNMIEKGIHTVGQEKRDLGKGYLSVGTYRNFKKFLKGLYITQVEFYRSMNNPFYPGKKWKTATIIHDFPKDNTFRKVPDQLVHFKGQVFTSSASKVNLEFLYWEEELRPNPIFYVRSSPEHCRNIQVTGIGIKPDVDRNSLEKASKLRTKLEAFPLAIRNRNQESQLQAMKKVFQDVEERANEIIGRGFERRERIHKTRKRSLFENKKWIYYLLMAVILLGALSWFMGWIAF